MVSHYINNTIEQNMVLKTVERLATKFGVETCADPEGGRGTGYPPEKLQKNRVP